jgi:hypothetical protein
VLPTERVSPSGVRSTGLHAAQAVAAGFAGAVFVGTLLLLLPITKAGLGGATLMELAFQRGAGNWTSTGLETVLRDGDLMLVAGPVARAEEFGQLQ